MPNAKKMQKKIQMVIFPQSFLDQNADHFTMDVIKSLLLELNRQKTVVGENHINLRLGHIEHAYYQKGVGIVVSALITTENASEQLRNSINAFFAGQNENIYASFGGAFRTTAGKHGAGSWPELVKNNHSLRIQKIEPVEVSLLSKDYNPAIAGAMLRHRAEVEGFLTLDFEVNNGEIRKSKMSNEENKNTPPPVDDDKVVDEYIASIQEEGFKQGLVIGRQRSFIEAGLKKHEIELDEAEQKEIDEFVKTEKRPSDSTMKIVQNVEYVIKTMEKKAAKKNTSGASGTEKEGATGTEKEKKEGAAGTEKEKKDGAGGTVPPPKNDIKKDEKQTVSIRAKIKERMAALKKSDKDKL